MYVCACIQVFINNCYCSMKNDFCLDKDGKEMSNEWKVVKGTFYLEGRHTADVYKLKEQ